ncbi:hypothetical protein Tco_0975498 [Tanacetum coccineum]|uniref:Uncharacterized protein n=1 Tax=Tanacetum coccineum TaxID=301880 RepID=A0ABQ5EEP4_9ASTR
MASNEETNAAGTDTRPPMLVESDYDSWKIRIHRYIRGKPNGKLIWNSIQNGPTPHPMITDPPPTGSTVVPAPRKKLDSEFNEEENKLEMADTQAEIILSQGLPRHIFNILNQTSTAQEIWNNVELLMQGSGRTLQQRKEDLFDEYERFRAIGNESIHDYFVRFHKLVNDMKITQLEIPTHQMNTKFVNNLPAYWGKYVTNVKQNMDISTTPYVQIYTHLKAYEPHAKKTLKKQEQSTSIVDPLAYVAHTTSAPALSSPSTPSPQPTAQSPNDALMATMTQIANLLSGFQKQFPPTNNQLRTSPSPPASESELVGESSTAAIPREDGDRLLPGFMRRDIDSLFGRMVNFSRRLYGREMAHALVEKKGEAKDRFYSKLILDLGNKVRSSVEQGTAAMENLVEKLENVGEKAECKKLKKEHEEAEMF